MKKCEFKIGTEVLYNGRKAVVNKVKGRQARVSLCGESSRWANIDELEKLPEN